MTDRKTIMKAIDNGLMKNSTDLKSSGFYHSLSEMMGAVDDDYKPIVKYTGLIFLFLIPIMITAFFAYNNFQYKKTISQKENVINLTNSYLQQRSAFASSLTSQIDSKSLKSQANFLSHVRSAFSAASTPGRPIISEYENNPIGSSIIKASGRVSFANLQTSQLSRLLKEIVVQKMKIGSIIVKNQNKKLTGHMDLIHYGKNQTNE